MNRKLPPTMHGWRLLRLAAVTAAVTAAVRPAVRPTVRAAATAAVTAASLLAFASAQPVPSMLYLGTLDASKPVLEGGEYYDLYEYQAEEGETVLAYLHSGEVDAFLGLLDPQGNVVDGSDDAAGAGTDAWLVAELAAGTYTFVVTTAFAGEEGSWQLFVASGLGSGGEFDASLEPGRLVVQGGRPADVHLIYGRAGESIELAVDSEAFDAMLLVAAPDGTFSSDDDSVGANPRLSYQFPADGIYPVFVKSYDGRIGAYRARFGSSTQTPGTISRGLAGQAGDEGAPASSDQPGERPGDGEETSRLPGAPAEGAIVPLAGNTWIYQTMSYPSAFGGMANEFVSGHLTLFPAGRYDMQLRIGDFLNRYSGAYQVTGDVLSLEGYGDVTFGQSGVRATFWDSAGSIYGLALEGSCEGGVCAIR